MNPTEKTVEYLHSIGQTGKSLLALKDLTDEQMLQLVEASIMMKERKHSGENVAHPLLRGKNIALIFEKASTRTRCSTLNAVRDEGGAAEYLGGAGAGTHFGKKESVKDSARVLGRLFDGIMFRGFRQRTVEELAQWSGVPVWNGLTDDWHPTQILADFQTIRENFGTLKGLTLAYAGDGRDNVCNSLMVGCAKAGINMIDICPPELSPAPELVTMCREIAKRNGSEVIVSHDPENGAKGANVLYTDVWVSMGEEALFEQRYQLLRPFQVDMNMARSTGNLEKGRLIFLHCLPAFHDHETEVSKECGAMEVSDEVFEAPFSKVFDEAENRMHSIKAMMLASLV
ncbi:MAG: ornithine carbamoyltransferase [Victivallales bacterium]|nr:ornithine carbamoyltransferase [Victivallales bacterium]